MASRNAAAASSYRRSLCNATPRWYAAAATRSRPIAAATSAPRHTTAGTESRQAIRSTCRVCRNAGFITSVTDADMGEGPLIASRARAPMFPDACRPSRRPGAAGKTDGLAASKEMRPGDYPHRPHRLCHPETPLWCGLQTAARCVLDVLAGVRREARRTGARGRPVRFQRVVGCGGPGSRVRVPSRGAKRGITRARVVRQRSRVAGYQAGGVRRWIRRAVYEIALQRGGYVLQVALRGRHLRLRTRPQEVRDQDRRQDRDDRHNDQQLNKREATLVVEPAQKELKHSLSPSCV